MPVWIHYQLSERRVSPSTVRPSHVFLNSSTLSMPGTSRVYNLLYRYRLVGTGASLSTLTANVRGRRVVYKRPDGTECLYADAFCLRRRDLLRGYSRTVVDSTLTLEAFKQLAHVEGDSNQFKLIGDLNDARIFEKRLALAESVAAPDTIARSPDWFSDLYDPGIRMYQPYPPIFQRNPQIRLFQYSPITDEEN